MKLEELKKMVLANLPAARKSNTVTSTVIVAYDRKTEGEDGYRRPDWVKVSYPAKIRLQPSTNSRFDSKFTEHLVASGILKLPLTDKSESLSLDDLLKLPTNAKSFEILWSPEQEEKFQAKIAKDKAAKEQAAKDQAAKEQATKEQAAKEQPK